MCGIYGIISDDVIPFDKRMFCTLGINNDSRGGDSCGIFIDGQVEYGINEEKYFIDFMFKSKLLQDIRKCRCAIGHDRKASVGSISLETAQPVIFKDENNKIKFVVIHNGTIHNYLDLADKYIPELDCTNMTDSQVMASIFYNSGYDCLSEYQGGAAFFIADYREENPRFFGWRGESKKSSYSKSNEDKEERPFYFTIGKNSIIFSSISTYLYTISRDVYILPENTLVEFKNKDIFTIQEYSRDNVDQSGYQYDKGRKKVYNYPTSAYGGNTNVGTNTRKSVDYGDSWDDYDEYSRWEQYWDEHETSNNKNTNHDTPPFRKIFSIDKEKDRDLVNVKYDIERDLYTNNDKLCHGEYSVSMYGYGPGYSGNKSNPKHYFWAGVHLCAREAFEFLEKMAKKNNLDPKGLLERYDNLVHYFSCMPYKLNHTETANWVMNPNYYTHDICKDITVRKCFDGRAIKIKDGMCVSVNSEGFPQNYSAYKDRVKLLSPQIDYTKLKSIYWL